MIHNLLIRILFYISLFTKRKKDRLGQFGLEYKKLKEKYKIHPII